MKQCLKLSEYAKRHSITYRTAWNHFISGKLKNSFKDVFGNIFVKEEDDEKINNRCIIYARVSNNNRKESLIDQQKFLEAFASSKNYVLVDSYREVASGMNDSRKVLEKILNRDDWDVILIENKDRLTRFGFNYIETLLKKSGKRIEVVNVTNDDKHDLMTDLISIIYSFSARLYGKRKAKRKTLIEKFLNS